MNIILIQKTYSILMKEYTNTYDAMCSANHNMYKFITQEYRDYIYAALVGRYFSTKKRKELKVVDITFFYNGHITIHGVEHNSQIYRNYSFNEVTII